MEEKPKQSIPISHLKELKEFDSEQQIGILTLELNEKIQARLKNELTFRLFSDLYEEDKSKKVLEGLTKAKGWIEGDNKEIEEIRKLIKELKEGEFKI